jgi:hypothetical protein
MTTANSSAPRVLGEILDGGGLNFSAAAKLIPGNRGAKHANPATLWRWHRIGHSLNNGTVVHLEAVRLGNQYLTSRRAVERFAVALTEASSPSDAAAAAPIIRSKSLKRRTEESQRAAEQLKRRHGI